MKIKKLVRVIAHSECIDVDVLIEESKANRYLKFLNRTQKAYLKSITEVKEVKYRPRGRWGYKTRKVKHIPPGAAQKLSVRIEPAGEFWG